MSTPTNEVFSKIFGSFEPSESESKCEDFEKLAADLKKEKEIKEGLFQKSFKQIHLDYYGTGGILFTARRKTNDYTKTFTDCLIITVSDRGMVEAKSEALAMNIEVEFLDRRLEIIPRKTISTYEITQHKCASPDCHVCTAKDVNSLPYMLTISGAHGSSFIYFKDFYSAFNTMSEIEKWVQEP